MDFGKIYDQWENRQKDGKARSVRKEMEKWLETNPIPSEFLEDRDGDDMHPTQAKALKRSELRKMDPEDSVDLHGMTAEEALIHLKTFLESARKRGLRKVLVIHGRGLHSRNPAVLPGKVRSFIENNSFTGEYGYADKRHGGSGATWVVLRQRSR